MYQHLLTKRIGDAASYHMRYDLLDDFLPLLKFRSDLDVKDSNKKDVEKFIYELLQDSIPIHCHVMRCGVDHTRSQQRQLSYKLSKGFVLEFNKEGQLINIYDERKIYRRNHGKHNHTLDNPYIVQVSLYHRARLNYETMVVFLSDCVFIPVGELEKWVDSYTSVLDADISLIRYSSKINIDVIKERLFRNYGSSFGSIKIANNIYRGWFIKLSGVNRVHPWSINATPRLASDYSFPEDPIFDKSNIKPIFKRGRIADVQINDKSVFISGHAIRRFASRFRECEIYRHSARYPEIMGDIGKIKPDVGIGIYILILTRMLERAKEVVRKNSVLQIIEHGYQNADYLSSYGWIFVMVDNILSTCYEKGDIEKAGYKTKQRKKRNISKRC